MSRSVRYAVLFGALLASRAASAQTLPEEQQAAAVEQLPVDAVPSEEPVESASPVQTITEAQVETADVSESEVLAELQALEGGGVQRGVSLSGFMDFNYRHAFRASTYLRTLDRRDSFYLGNINLYIRGNITAKLRSLVEVRFLYLPNGARDPLLGGDYTRTLTSDYNDYDRPLKWGGVEIERAHGEYEFHQLFTVRVGQFLTPYGIWNVDHGSPTVIPISVPYVIGQGLIPERQTGFELFGNYDINDHLQLAYHLTLSNGRGPFDSHFDLDRNKAVGGRLRLSSQTRWGDLTVGFSSYYGRYTNATGASSTAPARIINQRDELALAGDLRWTFKGVHVQWELVHGQNAYTEQGRAALVPDRANWGTYALLGYRIPVAEVMPFVMLQHLEDEFLDLEIYSYGLNYRPLPELVLKVMGTHGTGEYGGIGAKFTLLDTQIAWAF